MKKVLISLVLVVATLFGGGYFLAFTKSGNKMLLPFINSYLKQNVKGAKIVVDSFELKPSHIVADATINDMAKANVDGDFSLSKKDFDIIYTLKANKIKAGDLNINDKIYIKGKAVGDLKKALIFGVGKVAGSDIEYKLDLVDKNPQNITAKIDRANLSKLLALAGQKPYADGVVNLVAKIPSLDKKNLKGDASLSIIHAKVNSKLVNKDFKINIPRHTTFDLNSKAILSGDKINADAKLISSLANLFVKNLKYNIKSNSLNSPYSLNIPNLSKLNSLTNMSLHGSFKADGKLSLKNKNLTASINTNSLGGELNGVYTNNKIVSILKGVKTSTVFNMLGLPKYSDAHLSGELKLNDIKNLNGNFKITADGVNSKQNLKKMYNFDSDKDIKYHLSSNGTLKNSQVFVNADLKNTFGDIKLQDATYNIKSNSFRSNYEVYVDNLAKLNYIAKQKLVGDLKVVGNITKEKDLVITGSAKKFDGSENFKLINDKLTAHVKGAKLTKIQKTLSYPLMLEASTDANLDYNLKSSHGEVHVVMSEAKMLPNKLTKILKGLGGTDLSAEHYNDTKLDARLSKSLIDFDFHAISKSVALKIEHGKIYQPAGKLDALLEAKADKNNLKLKISGTTSNPKIGLDRASIRDSLKAKAKEKLKAKVDAKKEEIKEKIKDKLKDKLKNELKNGLFKKLF